MIDVLTTVMATTVFLWIVISIKRRLFDESGEPRSGARRFLIENKIWLHPHAISSYGFLLALISMVLYLFAFHRMAVILFIVASFFDNLDGAVARASGLESRTGEHLDPLFDKTKTLPPILYFGYLGCFSMWLAVVFACLDVFGQLIRPLIHFLNWKYGLEVSVASNIFGKVKTVFACILIVYCDLQMRVSFVPHVASYGLDIVMFFAILSILFKFKEEIPPLRYLVKLYGAIAKA